MANGKKRKFRFVSRKEFSVEAGDIRQELNRVRLALEVSKDKERLPLLVAGVSGAALIIATIGAPIIEAVMADPAGMGCSKEKSDAYDLWTKTGVWTPMPKSADDCDVNGYMDEVMSDEVSGGQ